MNQDDFLQAARDPTSGLAAGRETWFARAPGRLDVLGGVGDYSGALVLELPLACATWCAVQRRSDRRLRIVSPQAADLDMDPLFECDLSEVLVPQGGDLDPLRERFQSDPSHRWAAYAAGAFAVLSAEGRLPGDERGASLFLFSDVPLGAGVSSSAALEVSTMAAVGEAFGVQLSPLVLSLLCQRVEHKVAGAPCGIMDQITCALGEEGKLLALRCRPHTLEGQVEIPRGIQFVGIDSGVKHSVGGSRYRKARVATFMGRRILQAKTGKPAGDGYLTEWTVHEFRATGYQLLPALMTGEEFLRQYGETGDTATTVDPTETYAVRDCAMHPILENARVMEFRDLLSRGVVDDRALTDLGRLMLASHSAYDTLLGLGSPETDLLVDLVVKSGTPSGLYGAKITGGGSGGVVAVLAREGSDAALERVADLYRRRTGVTPILLRGSSAGAVSFGVRKVIL